MGGQFSCVYKPPRIAEYHGFEAVVSFPYDSPDIRLGMYFAGVLLIIFAVRTVFKDSSTTTPTFFMKDEEENLPVGLVVTPSNDSGLSSGAKQRGQKGGDGAAGGINSPTTSEDASPAKGGQLTLREGSIPVVKYTPVAEKAQANHQGLISTKKHPRYNKSLMRYIIAGYSLGTGFFAWTRAYWDTGKILLVLAAAHNLAEWMLISFLFFPDERVLASQGTPVKREAIWPAGPDWTAQKGMALAFFWIWFVITATCALEFIDAVIFEQVSGIACDYILLTTFIIKSTEKDYCAQHKLIAQNGLLASLWHFGQIWPLVLGTQFGLTGALGRFVEWILIFSSGMTFYHYSQLAIEWERSEHRWLDALEKEKADKPDLEGGVASTPKTDDVKFTPPGPSVNQRGMFWGILVFGLLLGGLTIGAPVVFNWPACPSSDYGEPALTGYTHIHAKKGQGHALRQELTKMLEPVRKEHGNLEYHLYSKVSDPDELLFVEKWADMMSLSEHINNSPSVNGIIRNEYVRSMMENETLAGPWNEVDPEKPLARTYVAVSFKVEQPVRKVWKVVDDWKHDCSWVQHCQSVTMLSEDLRRMNLDNGGHVDVLRLPVHGERYALKYEIRSGFTMFKQYGGTLRLTENAEGGTDVGYTAEIEPADPAKAAEAYLFVKSDFINSRVPYVQERFSKNYRPK